MGLKRALTTGMLCVLAAAWAAPAKEAPPPPFVAPSTPAEKPSGQARQVRRLSRRLFDLLGQGKYAQALPVAIEVIQLDPEINAGWYNLACVQARTGRLVEALDSLNRALRYGFSDFRRLQRDPALAPLRDMGGYDEILRRNAEIQRARAERIRQELRRRFGGDYIVEVDQAAKLVFATNVDRHMLTELRDHLTVHANAVWDELFDNRFEQHVTIVLPTGPVGIRIGPEGASGYYEHAQRLLVARRMGKVMAHEFTHALHAAEQDALGQRHPIWVAEGLATLYESSIVHGRRVRPEVNHRLTLLQWVLARDATIPWRRFLACTQDEFLSTPAICYPQCRYMMMYLYEKGLLKKWYDTYTAGYSRDRTGLAAMEKVFGKRLERIEADWKRWVAALEAPPIRLRSDGAYLGVETLTLADGLLVVRALPGSGAEAAGIRPGDVIVGIDGRRVADGPKLLRLVVAKGVGKTIRLRYRRDGKYLTCDVTLGRWTGEPAPPAVKKPA